MESPADDPHDPAPDPEWPGAESSPVDVAPAKDAPPSSDAPAAAADPQAVESARALIAAFLKGTRANQLYPRHSRVRKEHVREFATKVVGHVAAYGPTELRVRQSTIAWGENVLYRDDGSQKGLSFRLFVNGVRRIVIQPGITEAEGETLVDVLGRAFDQATTTDDLRTGIWEAGFVHVRFSLTDELFTQDEEKQFIEFMQTSALAHATAADARSECDEEMEALDKLPDPADYDEESPNALKSTPADLASLAPDVEAERSRELIAEFSEHLVVELAGAGGDAMTEQLEAFVDHVLASGEILRAARMLKALRDIATGTADPHRRKMLHDVLQHIGESQIVPKIRPLVPVLVDGDRDSLLLLLIAVGEPAVGPLCDLLDTAAKGAAAEALRVLAPRHPHALLPCLRDPRPLIVRTVMTILADIGSAELVGGFLPALKHPDVGVRREALRALVKIGGRDSTDLFLAALDDAGYEVRALALAALGDSRDPRAVPVLVRRVGEPGFVKLSNFEKRETFRTLARIGTTDAAAALIRILSEKKLLYRARTDEMRALAASALGIVGSTPARHALSLHVKDRSGDVQRAVAAALRAGGPAANRATTIM